MLLFDSIIEFLLAKIGFPWSDEIETFKCFNCSSCHKPFTASTTAPTAPIALLCGSAICKECFERDALLSTNKRIHQCGRAHCPAVMMPAFYLINLLTEAPLILKSDKSGYVLAEKFIAECPICIRKLNTEIPLLSPMDLLCGHAICLECSQKLRNIFSFDDDDEWESVYELRCPMCRAQNQYSEERFYSNAFLDFLNELPRMEAQLKVVKMAKRRDCFVKFFKLDNFSILDAKRSAY